MTSSPFLTIALPTFNRRGPLAARLGQLREEQNDNVELLVVDNQSDEPVDGLVNENLEGSQWNSVTIVRNRANVGLAANICRCYEHASGEWIWTLGDDDEIQPGCVGKLLELLHELTPIEAGGSPFGAVFCSTGIYQNPSRKEVDNIDDFWREMALPLVFSNHLFLSSNVVRRRMALENLGIGYKSVYSAAPHVAIASVGLTKGYRILLDPLYLVNYQLPEQSQRWNFLSVASGLPSLLDVPGLDRLVLKYLAPGLELVLWKPFLIGGIKLIFLDQHKSGRFWYATILRLFPFLRGRKRLFAIILLILAQICEYFPFVRKLGGAALRSFRMLPEDISVGQDRL